MIDNGNNCDKNNENTTSVLQSTISGELQVNNMYIENFKDALFFEKKATETGDVYEKRKYLRAAAVFYITCFDAWLAQKVYELLNTKHASGEELKSDEQKMLKEISYFENNITREKEFEIYIPSRLKMVNMMCKLNGNGLDNNKYKEIFSKKFIELNKYRNSFVHYAYSRYEINYDVPQIYNIVQNGASAVREVMKNLGYPNDLPKALE